MTTPRVKMKDENKFETNQFVGIKDKDLRCRNIAVMILNYYEDEGEELALQYAAANVKEKDELHVKQWLAKLAKERGYEIVEEYDS
jgi:hypothetical protein